jgi:type I site-specific restriction endonuclease
MLIKCKNIKTELWGIFHDGLREALPDIKMFAGGSYGYEASDNNDYKNNNHYMYDPTSDTPLQPMNGRDAYLAKIKGLKLEEDAIVLHCDILSEGINVKGFTNVMFVSGITQTDAKALQNIGRATRIVDEDRERLETGEISLDDMSNWVKPFCSVTIPFWNEESAEAKEKMVVLITQLREVGFQIEKFGTGSDINKNDKIDPELDPQNETKLAKRKSGIRELEQELEELAHLQRVANLHPVDYIFEMGS